MPGRRPFPFSCCFCDRRFVASLLPTAERLRGRLVDPFGADGARCRSISMADARDERNNEPRGRATTSGPTGQAREQKRVGGEAGQPGSRRDGFGSRQRRAANDPLESRRPERRRHGWTAGAPATAARPIGGNNSNTGSGATLSRRAAPTLAAAAGFGLGSSQDQNWCPGEASSARRAPAPAICPAGGRGRPSRRRRAVHRRPMRPAGRTSPNRAAARSDNERGRKAGRL